METVRTRAVRDIPLIVNCYPFVDVGMFGLDVATGTPPQSKAWAVLGVRLFEDFAEFFIRKCLQPNELYVS